MKRGNDHEVRKCIIHLYKQCCSQEAPVKVKVYEDLLILKSKVLQEKVQNGKSAVPPERTVDSCTAGAGEEQNSSKRDKKKGLHKHSENLVAHEDGPSVDGGVGDASGENEKKGGRRRKETVQKRFRWWRGEDLPTSEVLT